MKISSKQILRILYAIAWVIFIGLCIKAGGFIFNTFFTLCINPEGAHHFWNDMDLSQLYLSGKSYFIQFTVLISVVTVLQALLFYWIVKILHDKKLNLDRPFNSEVCKFIFRLSYISLAIGLVQLFGGMLLIAQLQSVHLSLPQSSQVSLREHEIWLFMGIILFVIAQIFKRGIELQDENELTV